MATKVKIITAGDFLEVTTDGIIDIDTSRQLLVTIAKAEHPPVDYELLVDLRGTRSHLSVVDVYEIAAELIRYGDTFRRKVALLVDQGINFEQAHFFETCSHNRGFSVNAFSDYETAIRWVLSAEDQSNSSIPAKRADGGDNR
jgi:hypothetical protein